MLTFTSVYFSESGLFNGLRPIQIKKILPPALALLLFRFPCGQAVKAQHALGPAIGRHIPRISVFAKQLFEFPHDLTRAEDHLTAGRIQRASTFLAPPNRNGGSSAPDQPGAAQEAASM